MSEPRRCNRLAEKRKILALPEPSTPPPPPKKKKMSNAQQMKAYREKLKTDPEKYQAYLEANKLKCQLYRASLNEEQRKAASVESKARTQKSRAKKKEQLQSEPKKVQTRLDILKHEKQKEKWNQQYKEKREQMHWRTKAAINAKRREKYRESKNKRKIEAEEVNSKSTQCDVTVVDERNPAAQRKALQRARAALPSSPRKFVQTINDLVRKSSPRKRHLFKTFSFDSTAHKCGQKFLEACRRLQKKYCNEGRKERRLFLAVCKGLGSAKYRSALLGCHRNTVSRHEKKVPKKEKQEKELDKLATSFLEETATPLPDRKLVSKKTGKPAFQLRQPLREMHTQFCESSGKTMPFSTFAKCRPPNVKLMCKAKLRQCLCEYCTNVQLILTTINTLASTVDNSCRIRSERHAVDLLTCDSKNKDCCYGTCDKCGVTLLEDHLRPLMDHDGQLKWYRWESKTITSKEKQISRKMLLSKRGTIEHLVEQLKPEVVFLAQHLFRADWQYRQFQSVRDMKPFPIESVCMVLDFAENFACTYQEEVQAAHWHHDQVTVHPAVTYYHCPGCDETVTESLVFISSDLKHDYHAVHHFSKLALNHLREKRGLTITNIIEWTDGCSAQYKSKGPFADIASSLNDFDATLERHFLGSRHGKGPSDGESAVVKHHAATAVKAGRAIIAAAEDLFEFCRSSSLNKQPPVEGCQHSLRSFFWVGADDVQRQREDRIVLTVPGTRSFHSVKCVEMGKIMTRHLTCCCDACRTGVGKCNFGHVTGAWSSHSLRRPRQLQPAQPQPQPAQPQPQPAQPQPQPAQPQPQPAQPQPQPAQPQPQPAQPQPQPAQPQPQPREVPTPQSPEGLVASSVESSPQKALSQCVLPKVPSSEPESSSGLTPSSMAHTGSWVKAVFVTEQGTTREYMGVVLDTRDQEVQIKCLRKRDAAYVFPDVDDISWIDKKNVDLIAAPSLNRRSQYVFLEATL